MAIYHLSVKTISRSAGRSATAAAAYRAGVKIEDEQTGEVHDYRRKSGIETKMLVMPPEYPDWALKRAKLWNMAEAAEKRKNSTVAREIVIALPAELNAAQRRQLAGEFALKIVREHRCIADVAIHAPDKDGDNRNYHAHILLSTRRLTAEGFTEKTRELDDKVHGSLYVKYWRERFAELQNEHLEAAGHSARVDHRTLEEQGIERVPSRHLGVHATAIERRTGEASRRRIAHHEQAIGKALLVDAVAGVDRSIEGIERELSGLHRDLKAEQLARAQIDPQKDFFKVRADAFRSGQPMEAVVEKYPELAGCFAVLDAFSKQMERDGFNAAQQKIGMDHARRIAANSIEKGKFPSVQVYVEERVEVAKKGKDLDR